MNYEHEVVVPRAGMPFKIDIFEGRAATTPESRIGTIRWRSLPFMRAAWSLSCAKKKIRVESGEFIIINTNELHSIRAEKANLAVYVQIPISEFKNYLTADHFISFHKKGKGAMAIWIRRRWRRMRKR